MAVVLHPGRPGDEDGEGYMPEISLEHDGPDGRSEMYVNVGEEAGGMIEGVSYEQFEEIAKALAGPR